MKISMKLFYQNPFQVIFIHYKSGIPTAIRGL